jgi:Poly A polymerase head domain/Probable RNA and SrmB- binding site of polymerase A
MDDARIRDALAGEDGWIVGGAVRDERLGRPVVDVDVACREPREAASRYAWASGGAVFPLSETHGAWRVAVGAEGTVDFTPLPDGIEQDLATRDFTFNAIAIPVGGDAPIDPHGGLRDLDAGVVRAVSDSIFADDPIRLLRAVRFEDELGFRMDERTEQLLRERAGLVGQPAGERILAELARLSAEGFRRLAELGLLEPLGGSLDGRLDALDDSAFRLTAVFGEELARFPISNDLRRYARTLLAAHPPDDDGPRAIHRFRRATEPWALEALVFVDRADLAAAVEESRRGEPEEPLVRGDELGLPPGPEIGRILAAIDEERAAGTISTREEALALARSLAAR